MADKTASQLSSEISMLEEQLKDARVNERRARMREERAQITAKLTPAAKQMRDARDALTAKIFNSPDGQTLLAEYELSRPAMADEIKEALARNAANASTPATPASPTP